jgi:hypothetical protein
LHEFVGTGHREAASQAISLVASEELDRARLERRVANEGLTEALAVIQMLSERIARGERIETYELHDAARELRRTM